MAIGLSNSARAEAVASIERDFSENLGQRIGNVAAGGLLSFVVEEIGPAIDIRAVADVRQRLLARVQDLDIEIHEHEFADWRRRSTSAPKGRR